MSSRNVEICKAAHQAFNKRDFDGVMSATAEDVVYRDRARGLTFRGRDEYRKFVKGWVESFSDAEISEPSYLDAGDSVIVQFTGRGHNDGAFGPLPATGKPVSFGFCEIIRLNDSGQIIAVDAYYDQLTILTQLGQAAVPQQGAAA